MTSKRVPKMQRTQPDTRRYFGLSPYRGRAAGWTGYTCAYCGNAITRGEIRRDEVAARLAQDPTLEGTRRSGWKRYRADPSGLTFGHINYKMAHEWCRLKAILGPKRARHHRKGKKR